MKKIQHQAIEEGFLDLLGTEATEFQELDWKDLEQTLVNLAAVYIGLLADSADKKDVSSSGYMQDNIKATDVTKNGFVYEIGITAPDYASYQDEGVNGWAVNRGSRFQFRTKGVGDEMRKSIAAWLKREGMSARTVKQAVSKREARGMDALNQKAQTVAYMIKRQGIKPTHFWSDATDEMNQYFETEIAEAIKIDIVNNIYGK